MRDTTTITAVLGPTNTGKTHRAIEQMLGHPTGMIGLPLRLLAREVYDKVSTRVGESRVALVTGEEKRVPRRPDYWVCTVEAMPVSHEVDFLAIDEVQLCAHPQRGHTFTERVLHARGTKETWFLGSASARRLLEALCPVVKVQSHPRLSRLTHAPALSLARLPARSAVVAFSIAQVYELAERLRAIKGGAAVVLGALSPRTRNAQVAMFESGEVDHLVATDAIGMGLNLNVRHVAFAALRKFDGRELRDVELAELSQIAGRAGRYTTDGTFGALSPLALPEPLAQAIELHQSSALTRAIWRSVDLDFSSVDALRASLAEAPPRGVLRRVTQADDEAALDALLARPEVQLRATRPDRVRLLWQVATVPDFRKLLFELHVAELSELYVALCDSEVRLSDGWMGERFAPLDRSDGDIDTLTARIASVRTLSYVSHQARWLADADRWQAETRALEDRLSDALHTRLIARFVDVTPVDRAPQSAPRVRRRPSPEAPSAVSSTHPFAALKPLRDALAHTPTARDRPEAQWVDELIEAPHERFHLSPDGRIFDGEVPLAALVAGEKITLPGVALVGIDALGAGARSRVQRRLVAWARDAVNAMFEPLRTPAPGPRTRGIAYKLEQRLGTLFTREVRDGIDLLLPEDRDELAARGVRITPTITYLPRMLTPALLPLRNTLALLHFQAPRGFAVPSRATVSLRAAPSLPAELYAALGYPVLGGRAIRADVLDRVQQNLARAGSSKPDANAFARWINCAPREVEGVLRELTSSPP